MGTMIELKAPDGHTLAAYRAEPAGKPRGGLVVIQEIFGVNSHIRAIADGYAADGYLAIAPALFDRVKRGVELGYTQPDIKAGMDIRGQVPLEGALKDVEAAIAAAANAGKVGIVGYCWGGFISWTAAARVAGLTCAVPYYGGGTTTDESIARQPRCPVMLHYGERDDHIPVSGVQKLAAAHPKQAVHIYAAGHGFNCDQRGSYDAASAKLARSRTVEFLRQHLG